MVECTQTIRRQFAEELFECVGPFCGIDAQRFKERRFCSYMTENCSEETCILGYYTQCIFCCDQESYCKILRKIIITAQNSFVMLNIFWARASLYQLRHTENLLFCFSKNSTKTKTFSSSSRNKTKTRNCYMLSVNDCGNICGNDLRLGKEEW